MAQLGFKDWTGKNLVIFGSGKMGTGLITYAHQLGARISVVTEPSTISARLKTLTDVTWIAFNDKAAVEKAVAAAHAVVTATGVAGAATYAADARAYTESRLSWPIWAWRMNTARAFPLRAFWKESGRLTLFSPNPRS